MHEYFTHIHTYIHTYIHAYIHTYIHTHTLSCIHNDAHTHTHTTQGERHAQLCIYTLYNYHYVRPFTHTYMFKLSFWHWLLVLFRQPLNTRMYMEHCCAPRDPADMDNQISSFLPCLTPSAFNLAPYGTPWSWVEIRCREYKFVFYPGLCPRRWSGKSLHVPDCLLISTIWTSSFR